MKVIEANKEAIIQHFNETAFRMIDVTRTVLVGHERGPQDLIAVFPYGSDGKGGGGGGADYLGMKPKGE